MSSSDDVAFRQPALADLVATLDVEQTGEHHFVATQLDNPHHHIVGGHIAGQALMAASRTAPGRVPHSMHAYYLRAGDARRPVDLQVEVARDGGTLATRHVTARQDGQILLEMLSSFSTAVDAPEYQQPIPEVPEPDSLAPAQVQLAPYASELGGYWVQPHPFDQRYIDPHPRVALELGEPSPRIRLWWKPAEPVPVDAALHSALLTYLSGTKMVETALAMRRATQASAFNALIDHALWFQRPVDLSDWVLSDQFSPSGVAGRGLATSTMYNRAGQLVCVATQELYFGRGNNQERR